ncbi:2'-5' RNA ligase [Isoptericola jiangsuensis]|uniref:RNA 2',3'-cyclic phosphodiesterase n=1 Tax=Isoptericola jiangsuensis TaxID=548579 RepID=A0A2A9EX96_9MICO|nr:RNA 2',3'-cyclic phosphodiesterase [Isoptericola jiangsuensis]PFG42900.1 2'-5' RNA ligase [Isoptericola jiangsuensis]
MRLFSAVYPSPESLTHLDGALGGVGGPAVADPGTGLRWVPREQRHVTLAFHGEVPDGAVDGYVDALGDAVADVGPFDLALAGSGTFSGRTLWVGVGGDVDALRSLARRVDDAAADAGVSGTDRVAGRPHLTVARASASVVGADRARERRRRRRGEPEQEPASPFGRWAHALAVYRGPGWTVGEVLVVASRLGEGRSGGPAHEVVARAALPGHLD